MAKHPNIYWFYKSLHARGEDTSTLAEAICTARTYVSRCIDGHERRGNTWQRIKRLLTVEEIELLEAVETEDKRPQETICRAKKQSNGCTTRRAQVCAVVEHPYSVQSGGSAPANLARPVVRAFNQWRRKSA
jgi:hypothetical protein